jgi:Na+/proline symporter
LKRVEYLLATVTLPISFNIDITIVVVFLAINLLIGIYSGLCIKKIREYAVGNRNFSTPTIAATIIATWIGGDFLLFIYLKII